MGRITARTVVREGDSQPEKHTDAIGGVKGDGAVGPGWTAASQRLGYPANPRR